MESFHQIYMGGSFVDTYPDIPFGGYKHSGVGREMGIEGYLEYTEIKNIASTF